VEDNQDDFNNDSIDFNGDGADFDKEAFTRGVADIDVEDNDHSGERQHSPYAVDSQESQSLEPNPTT
jgi:hypothetical protein